MYDLLIDLLNPEYLLFYLFAYGLAAVPTSYLVARFMHRITMEKATAHSHTASNIFKTMSKRAGIIVFGCDFVKGLLPCAIALSLDVPIAVIAVIGLFAVIGHCFSIWLGFLGGHGGSTAAGALLMVYWPAGLALLVANFVLIVLGFSTGLASILGIIIGIIVVFLGVANKLVLLIVSMMAAVIIARHWLR